MRVFIGCSAKDSIPVEYRNLATEVSTILAKRGHKLVFGGVDTGMMGKCFMTFKYEGARTKAILDKSDQDYLEKLDVDAYEVTPTTFRRSEEIYKSSEMILVLPGGIGTLAELFSCIDEKRTRNSEIPIVLFNYNDYYKSLVSFLKTGYKEGFITEKDLKRIDIVNDLESFEYYIDSIDKSEEN